MKQNGDLLFSFQFSPSGEEFKEVNKVVSSKGFDEDGYGWAAFLMEELKKLDAELVSHLDTDPESETCSIVTDSSAVFQKLLFYLSKVFQEV